MAITVFVLPWVGIQPCLLPHYAAAPLNSNSHTGTMHNALCTMHYEIYSMHYELCSNHYELSSMQYALYTNAVCTMQHTMHFALCSTGTMQSGTIEW